MKIYFLIIVFFVSCLPSLAQTDNTKPSATWDLGIEGMIATSIGKDFYAFNIGGPTLLVRLKHNLKIGVAAVPSFYINEGKTGAKLGVAPRIDLKNIVLIAPCYHFESENKWVYSFGIGYKFHSKK